jgi:superfamily II DNA/RNA helicase
VEVVIEALVQKVWANPSLQRAIESLERDWIRQELSDERLENPETSRSSACRYLEAAAILACSREPDHRLAAFRIATYTYDLFRGRLDGVAESVRVVLTRLGNFPAISTADDVESAGQRTPWSMIQEELVRRQENEVRIAGAAWHALVNGKSLAISAPTSTGKSFIVQGFISEAVGSNRRFSACYLVPTRALITQVQSDLQSALAESGVHGVDIVTVPVEKGDGIPESAIFVLTQERLQVLLSNYPNLAFHFLMVDEAHSVQEADRGIILQSVIDEVINRNPSVQVLFASPTVANLEVFSEMTGRDDIFLTPSESVSVSQNFIDVKVVSPTRGDVRISVRDAKDVREVGDWRIGQVLSSRIECLVHVAHKFGAAKQSIVFADGQADAEKIAYQIAEMRAISGERSGVIPSLSDLADLAAEAVHPKYVLTHTAKYGVAFHYGNMPTILRTAIERAFADGSLRYLVCTSTLLAGVNLPARNLFLCKPNRRKGVALDSVDFWNLAGRAGRLRKEFQGNIFLIDYDKWAAKPLDSPKLAEITPAIQGVVSSRSAELSEFISRSGSSNNEAGGTGLDAVFLRLLADKKSGRIAGTLDRAGLVAGSDERRGLELALSGADSDISLSAEILKETPTISPYRQQELFDHFREQVSGGKANVARGLILAHPRESGAFESYLRALDLCHKILFGRRVSERQNRFFATMILKWMQGVAISELIDRRASMYQTQKIDKHIRDTLDLVERELRFNYVRAFSCYSILLKEAFKKEKLSDLEASIPSIPLYLEIGASDKTMVSLISLGLSRLAAKRLTNICPVKSFTVAEAKAWLLRQDIEMLGFSRHIVREVEGISRE